MKDEVPEPEGCFAVGPGLQYGLVTCKNNFQVKTTAKLAAQTFNPCTS